MSIPYSGEMRVCTTFWLPTIRGPMALAKTVTSLDVLADGRLVAVIGPGSSSRDYLAAGVPFEERWKRFDEAAWILRRVFNAEEPKDGAHYAPAEVAAELQPRPQRPIPIWIGSWGSEAGLRRVARLAGVGLQHHARGVRRGQGDTRPRARTRGKGPGRFLQRAGHDVALGD